MMDIKLTKLYKGILLSWQSPELYGTRSKQLFISQSAVSQVCQSTGKETGNHSVYPKHQTGTADT